MKSAGKLLAWQIKETAASRMIMEIVRETGQTNPQEINILKKFYMKLYSESVNDPSCTAQFFKRLNIPSLSVENREVLEQPLAIEEINQAIFSMPCPKSPGPHGFTTKFYKSLNDQISPLLLF